MKYIIVGLKKTLVVIIEPNGAVFDDYRQKKTSVSDTGQIFRDPSQTLKEFYLQQCFIYSDRENNSASNESTHYEF